MTEQKEGFEDLFDRASSFLSSAVDPLLRWNGDWFPRIDVREGDKDIMVNVELPGLQPGDIDIRVDERRLTISGEKKMEKEEKRSDIHIFERRFGSFTRTVDLPVEVDADKVKAELVQGVLKIEMPKKKISARKSIPVKTA
ncbi:MAG: Hsp20/alpha crystallin family protein [Syntrophobacteraceae bacterium]|nr:Hsp20/alpha crystallin family protein [Syntrophobacteraceae bacterium]